MENIKKQLMLRNLENLQIFVKSSWIDFMQYKGKIRLNDEQIEFYSFIKDRLSKELTKANRE